MGTNCALLLADFFLSYEAEFMQKRCNDKKKLQKLKPLISLSSVLMTFCQLIFPILITGFH
jgi:hypothetical protein